MRCNKEHRYDSKFSDLPFGQEGDGRHKCAGCAYDKGYEQGLSRADKTNVDLSTLPDCQAGEVRHKSAHAAWAKGYLEGVLKSYE